jgi:hypothetical protein
MRDLSGNGLAVVEAVPSEAAQRLRPWRALQARPPVALAIADEIRITAHPQIPAGS